VAKPEKRRAKTASAACELLLESDLWLKSLSLLITSQVPDAKRGKKGLRNMSACQLTTPLNKQNHTFLAKTSQIPHGKRRKKVVTLAAKLYKYSNRLSFQRY